jgi:lipopolysaccharide export LptBFGC system permease protein LptF
MGFVLTIVLVFLYYFVSLTGISLGRNGRIPPMAGVWAANTLFLIAGLVLLYRVERSIIDLGSLRGAWEAIRQRFTPREHAELHPVGERSQHGAVTFSYTRRQSVRYPMLLDEMILRDFATYLGMILASFILLTLVFTFFELLGDILRNRIPLIMVGQYLLNVTPSMIYIMAPLSVLLAVLTTIGLLQKSNEITAMKATGTSIYRVIFPIFIIAAVISTGLFFFDQYYIPAANQRQETLRNQIKGKPAQTYLRPDRKWIFGEHNNIYYYEFFDPDQNTFANITVFEFDPTTFELTGRVHASRAHWSVELKKWISELPRIRRKHLPHPGRASQLLQERSAPEFGDELPGVARLHRRPAAERL